MIPKKVEKEIYTGKSQQSQNFGVEWNAKAFEILSDSLYTDKERAIAREYMTNAYDAHVDAGCVEKSFRVHVPTRLEPYFEVEDFGIGLDEDGVMKTFATFFHSTKETSNEVNGCLGLGSKSAFAVSDTFTIISNKDGVKSTYVCYKNREGVPMVDKKFSKGTEDGNGVTIRIPVNSSRIGIWADKIWQVMGCYEVTPTHNLFTEYSQYETKLENFKSRIKKVRGAEHGVYEDTSYSGVFVLMGNVLYPIDNPESLVKNQGLREIFSRIQSGARIILRSELGELNIAPSREALSMDYYTRTTVARKLTKLLIKKYRKLLGDVGGVEWDNYYKFYKTFKNTSLWKVFEEMTFPFSNGYSLKEMHESSCYRSQNVDIPVLKYAGFDNDTLKGYVSKYPRSKVFSAKLSNVSHRYIKDWDNIVIAYGDSKCLRETVININQELYGATVLWTNDCNVRDKLQKYFGVEDKYVVTTSDYFVAKRRKTTQRHSFGKQEDHVVISRYLDVEKGTIEPQQPVDLSRDGVVYADNGLIKIGNETKTMNSYDTIKLLKWAGVQKVVIKNRNIEGKITRSEVKSAGEVLKAKIKPYKVAMIRQSVRNKICVSCDTASKLLSENVKEYRKLRELKKGAEGQDLPPINIWNFGWNKTPLYKQEEQRVNKLQEQWRAKLEAKKNKLPLLHRLYDEDQIKYYLKLEKVIK